MELSQERREMKESVSKSALKSDRTKKICEMDGTEYTMSSE